MPEEKIPYTTGATKRGKLVKAPTKAKIRTMAVKAGDEDETQTPPQTQKGVPSPMRVLHKTPGLSPEEYKELLRKMSGPITASVINTYATFAELIMEREDREQDLNKMTTKQKVLAQVAADSGSDKAKRDLGWKYKLNVATSRPEVGRPYKITNTKGKEGWEWKKPKKQFRPGIDRSSLPRAKK